jgi:hypothetical protein
MVRSPCSELPFPELFSSKVVLDGAKEQIVLARPDVIFVPRTAIAHVNIWVRQHIRDLLLFPLPRFPGL